MQSILVTGGAGFIGSNFIEYFLKNNSNVTVVNLDKLTYAGSLANNAEVLDHNNFKFIEGDICDTDLMDQIFADFGIDAVIHFAAESHVDNSIDSPNQFIKTNIDGTFCLLEAARKYWMEAPFQFKNGFSTARFHHISTDEVYGTLGPTGYFTENTPYAPNSPYSASKASSDFLVRSYFHTFGLPVVTTNCSNNYGPKQHDEKLIPTIIRNAIRGNEIPIYGNGKNVRDWLFVEDHCEALELVFKKGKLGETYIIGGNNEKTNIEIANLICEILDKSVPKESSYKNQITFVTDRPGHDFRYAIDATKIKNDLHWEPKSTFESGLQKTIDWYLRKYS